MNVLEPSNQPRADDGVLGGKILPPIHAGVLGGIAGIKNRLESDDESVKSSALADALNFCLSGLELVIQALKDESESIQKVAYFLLRKRPEILAQQALTGYNYWRWLECVHTLEKKELAQETCIAISTDGKTLVGGNWQCLKIRELPSGNLVKILGRDLHPTAIALSPDHQSIISGCRDKTIKILDFNTGTLLKKLEGHSSWVRGLAMSLDGKILVSSGEHIKIWDLETGTLLRTLKDYSRVVYCVAISPDGKTVISSSSDQTIKIWDLKTGTVRRILQGHLKEVRCVAISPDNRTVVSGSSDQTIKIWDLETGTLHRTLQGHSNSVNCLAIGQTVISNSQDGVIKIWGFR